MVTERVVSTLTVMFGFLIMTILPQKLIASIGCGAAILFAIGAFLASNEHLPTPIVLSSTDLAQLSNQTAPSQESPILGLPMHVVEESGSVQLASYGEPIVRESEFSGGNTKRVVSNPYVNQTIPDQAVSNQAVSNQAVSNQAVSNQGRRSLPQTSPTPTSNSEFPKQAKDALQGLSDEELVSLSSLPPMCTSELPGLDLSDRKQEQEHVVQIAMQAGRGNRVQQARTTSWNSEASRDAINQRATQSAEPFQWPDHAPNPSNSGGDFAGQSAADLAAMPNPHANASGMAKLKKRESANDGEDPHLNIYSRGAFPSATECATCHQQIYDEWASSSHAYASVSPMFHKFENTINKLAQGTIGYFCLRCHAPVATTMGLRRDQAIWDGPRVFREGVTCVACHRVKTPYTKADGERRIEPGEVYDPVYGSGDGNGVDVANKYSQFFKIKKNSADKSPGQPIHKRAIQFEELKESSFCMSCHQVAVKPGIKLEVVWDQYRASPACRDGVSCQDCHMGKVPGVDAGYSIGPAAVVNDKVVGGERRHSNHMFYGPGYSIAHPGIYPDSKKADRWKFNQWLEFDWRAGWGTDAFEDSIADSGGQYSFPAVWQDVDDRYDAREIVDANIKKLEYKRDIRRQLLENGSKLDGPFFADTPQAGDSLKFRYCLTNINPGHNMPSGSLGAQPQIWMNVAVIGPDGNRVWESGYVDSNGDLCDNHSLDVLARKLPFDSQLMNLQTKFLTTNVKGTDREMYLPVNFDFDQLPFIRPAARPVTVINHPPFIRMEGHSIPPLGSRNVKYVVPARSMQQPGTYRISVRLRSRAEPIYFMRFCDSTPEMERSMNEWIADFHVSTVVVNVK